MNASETLAERLAAVNAAVGDAVAAAGRDAGEVTTIVVTKFHPASLVRELVTLGVKDFGESRHQEASGKASELADVDATWHFVGQVQSKKARQIRRYARVIHSVDRESLVRAWESPDADGEQPPTDVFLQINLTDDPARGGVLPANLDALADQVAGLHGVTLLGVMAVAPLHEEPREAFSLVRELSETLQRSHPGATALSMGMSGDFAEAIAEGATHLRIGTAITGNRPNHG
ncbi:MAG: YggS family pyridoxal phosphate-dependent enzyme [Rhodoglobus sp.]